MKQDPTDAFRHRARIAWVSPTGGPDKAVREAFSKARYEMCEPSDARPADVAVVDLRAHRLSAKAANTLAETTRRAAPDCGLVYLAPPHLGAAERAHLRRSGELVLSGDDFAGLVEACRARLRLRDLAEEAGERLKSIAASSRLAEFPPIATSSAPPSILVAGAPGPVSLTALGAAEKVAGRVAGVLTASQAMRALEADAFDCAVIIPQSDSDPLMGLARSMRRHRRFRDLPLVLVGGDAFDAARKRLASAYVAEALPADHVRDDLGARLLAVTRRARLAAAMRRFLSACAGDGVRDKLSGAFAPPFFSLHAERLFSRADETRRPLSLIGVRLCAEPDAEGRARGASALGEAARLINRVTRAEDFVARLSSDTFVILAPATLSEDASNVGKRIAGVVANTMFRTKRDDAPFAVSTSVAAIERDRRARLDETVARLFADLNETAPLTMQR